MRYIKLYEAFSINSHSELEQFCRESLAFLLDDGYILNVNSTNSVNKFDITLLKGDILIDDEFDGNTFYNEFSWSDIKDDFIPFMELLDDKYSIDYNCIEFFTTENSKTNNEYTHFTSEEIINDKPSELDCKIYEISFSVIF